MLDATEKAVARYLGRAYARFEAGWFNDEGTIQRGSNGKSYVVTLHGIPACTCPEYASNHHAHNAALEGKRVWRDPGLTCKHVQVKQAIAGHIDLLYALGTLAEPLKAQARAAYKLERDWVASRS